MAPAVTPIPRLFSLNPVGADKLPAEDDLINAAEALLTSTRSWTKGKTYNKVEIYKRPKGGSADAWFCRVSRHRKEEASFDRLWKMLGKNRMEKEKEYIPEMTKVTLIKQVSDTQSIWSAYYALPPPLSPRIFTAYQVFRLVQYPQHQRRAVMVSIPVDLSSSEDKGLKELEERGTRGKYVCVEEILELEGGNVVEWRMATCGTPGGMIPKFLVNKQMPAKIAEDVPHLLAWLQSSRSSKSQAADEE
ncbi:hypothetical protein BDN72DRAFT_800424 [Pluteus cervinus]|uniref:Uncharacterized protein n=1 Tax=Pluteus cervinus TaxID=181527 RepID=A0ACD3AKL8_9AGAR|nr:hypothetical protein BDN72DRAFT_800424 [Pluteus cervinus]